MTTLQQVATGQASPEVPINRNFDALSGLAIFAYNESTTDGLTWGYYGGIWGGTTVADGTLSLTASATNYVVVDYSTGALSVSTSTTSWNDTSSYRRVYAVTTGSSGVSSVADYRTGPGGLFDSAASASGSSQRAAIPIACGDESTAIEAGASKVTFRMPFAMTLSAVRASLTTAQTSGNTFTVDINVGGTSILSTKLTIDNAEKTSTTAGAVAVISDSDLADDEEVSIDVDQIGDGTATGLKVYLIGTASYS
jgi:hypothetical protein